VLPEGEPQLGLDVSLGTEVGQTLHRKAKMKPCKDKSKTARHKKLFEEKSKNFNSKKKTIQRKGQNQKNRASCKEKRAQRNPASRRSVRTLQRQGQNGALHQRISDLKLHISE
jgi:hypothetical protein